MPRHSNPDYEGNPVQRILETPDRQEVKEAVIVVVSWFGGDKSRKLGKKRDAIGGLSFCGARGVNPVTTGIPISPSKSQGVSGWERI